MNIVYQPIGIIHTELQEREGAPIQAAYGEMYEGRAELFSDYADGLRDLNGFSHAHLLYHFHKSTGYSLLTKPFIDNAEHGVFATRAPRRPNPIGLSLVTILAVDSNIVYFKGADIIDGTPLLDIKPFIAEFDTRENVRSGWAGLALKVEKSRRADDRFSSE